MFFLAESINGSHLPALIGAASYFGIALQRMLQVATIVTGMKLTPTRKEAAGRKQKGLVRGRKPAGKGTRRGRVPVLLVGRTALPTKLLTDALIEASEVLGGRDEAMRWLGTPVRALGFATPISLLGTKEGAGKVHDVLTQVAHGVW